MATASDEVHVSLLVIAGIVLATAACRRLLARRLAPRHPRAFLLKLSGAFQISACTHKLLLLAKLPPRPHVALALTYPCMALHGLTLSPDAEPWRRPAAAPCEPPWSMASS
ncbi:hypothetical protein lerEdw1_013807 [Lerista edwardsae]|nr:hypothetical protein lerEdw1_013807 [Lerista edwardsae]